VYHVAPMATDPRPRSRRRDDEEQDAALRALRSKLSGVLRRLPDVERRVLELRMGLVDGVPAKPGEVAERMGLTISEVRKIEGRAFERIREVGPIKGLEKFLGK
jgi:DNA-directed RNA polymerase sigma subunit (sigma70/sigma32)